jgi:type IV pilus assembly protein PilB
MNIEDGKLKDILVKENYVAEDDFKKAEAYSKSHRTSLVDYFLTEAILTEDLLGQAVAEYYKLRYADLNTNMPGKDQILRIPEDIAKKYRVVFFAEGERNIIVTTDVPDQKDLDTVIKKIFPNKKIQISYSLSSDIDKAFVHYHKPLETRFQSIISQKGRVAPEIIEEILEDALQFNSSDVHFEPQETEVVVRFRIDGVLQEAGKFPKEFYENILNRVKVEARLRIDEHYSAQDGAIRYLLKGKNDSVDVRVSIVPTLDGEKIVFRLLAGYSRGLTLADLGLTAENQDILESAGKKPFGMILLTGPTGSGKTTTLYALLKIMNRVDVNITTIEDPVEYKILGINQIQVNSQTNLTFSQGLRSIVRQDPDIVLVGEIRDEETAEIAVNAALTGHLLLSTFHANDSVTSILRLLDMKIEPFLLASTLEIVGSQRLVRKVCEHCKASFTIDKKDLAKENPEVSSYFKESKITLYKGKGCDLCNNTGYRGRMAIYEFIQVTPEIEEIILKNPSTDAILKEARKRGFKSMFEDGLVKVKEGVTTLDEVLRVSEPPKK